MFHFGQKGTCTSFIYRSSTPGVLLGNGVLKICSKFAGEHLCRSKISIELLRNFIEIALRDGCSPVNLVHIFRTPFLKNTYGRLILHLRFSKKLKYNHFFGYGFANFDFGIWDYCLFIYRNTCDALRDLVSSVQFKKYGKPLLRSLKVIFLHWCFSSFLNCTNGTKSRKVSHINNQ